MKTVEPPTAKIPEGVQIRETAEHDESYTIIDMKLAEPENSIRCAKQDGRSRISRVNLEPWLAVTTQRILYPLDRAVEIPWLSLAGSIHRQKWQESSYASFVLTTRTWRL